MRENYENSNVLELNLAIARAMNILGKANFSPNQPRVPAGNPDGGQWTDGGSNGRITGKPRKRPQSKPAQVDYDPEDDIFYQSTTRLFGTYAKEELDQRKGFLEAVAKYYKIDPNLIRGVVINETTTRYGGGYAEALISRIGEEFGGYGTYGPAQLGPDARGVLGLDRVDVLSYEGAIVGAANFLNIEREKLILEGVAKPTNAQIATRYNWGNWPVDGKITEYGIRVEYLINRFYK